MLEALADRAPSPAAPTIDDELDRRTWTLFAAVVERAAQRLAAVVVECARVLDPELDRPRRPHRAARSAGAYRQAIAMRLANIDEPGAPPPRVELSRIGVDAGVIGAATLVLHDLYAPTARKLSLVRLPRGIDAATVQRSGRGGGQTCAPSIARRSRTARRRRPDRAACGGSDKSSSSDSSSGAKASRVRRSSYWASNQARDDRPRTTRSSGRDRAASQQQSGVKVKFKVIPWSDLWNNITTATTSGKGPDVLNIGNTWSASLQATGAFMPFDGDTLKAIGGKDKFVQTSYSASGAPGKTPTSSRSTASPTCSSTTRSCSSRPASQPPKTWSEFVDTAKKLTKPPDAVRRGLVEGGSITENSHFAFILGRQNGGQLFDGNKPTFDSTRSSRASATT